MYHRLGLKDVYLLCMQMMSWRKKSGLLLKDSKSVVKIHFEAAKSLSGQNGEHDVYQQTKIGCSNFCDISLGL